MKKLNFLGEDAGFGINNTSAYTIINNDLLLIDCGSTIFTKLYMMDQTSSFLRKRDNISFIITHLHDDHVGSLGQLINYCFFTLNKKIKIHSKCIYLKTRLDIAGAPKEGYEICDNPSINFIKTTHCDMMDCYGFQTKIGETNIVYTGDTNTLEPFFPYINQGTEFYIDTSYYKNPVHLHLEYVLDILKRLSINGVDVYLMHLDNKQKIKDCIKDTNIHLCTTNNLNKLDILSILNDYQFDPKEYLVISGAAMVLYGFKNYTKDIDISVSYEYYQYLLDNFACQFEKLNQFNDPVFYINNTINFGYTYFNNDKNIIDDIPVQTKQDLIELKKQLNRPKDIKELKLIK